VYKVANHSWKPHAEGLKDIREHSCPETRTAILQRKHALLPGIKEET
jgi:hypothetical protein